MFSDEYEYRWPIPKHTLKHSEYTKGIWKYKLPQVKHTHLSSLAEAPTKSLAVAFHQRDCLLHNSLPTGYLRPCELDISYESRRLERNSFRAVYLVISQSQWLIQENVAFLDEKSKRWTRTVSASGEWVVSALVSAFSASLSSLLTHCSTHLHTRTINFAAKQTSCFIPLNISSLLTKPVVSFH